MVWYAHNRPMTHALCVVFGALTLAVAVAGAYYLAMVWPLVNLLEGLC